MQGRLLPVEKACCGARSPKMGSAVWAVAVQQRADPVPDPVTANLGSMVVAGAAHVVHHHYYHRSAYALRRRLPEGVCCWFDLLDVASCPANVVPSKANLDSTVVAGALLRCSPPLLSPRSAYALRRRVYQRAFCVVRRLLASCPADVVPSQPIWALDGLVHAAPLFTTTVIATVSIRDHRLPGRFCVVRRPRRC
jgi:hypothetical protein